MLEFKDKIEYGQYVKKLKEAVVNNSWKEYLKSNKYMDVYFSSSFEPDMRMVNLSSPYYSEISINAVRSCNVSSARKIIPSDWERVVGAVDYILKDECMPIAVIKLDNGEYYIENGKHRFYAHVLLGKEQIPVSVREIVQENPSEESMLRYNIPFYNNDGMDIAYPEKIEDFINQYLNVEKRIELIAKKTTEIGNLIADIEKNIDANGIELLRKQLWQLDNLHCDLKTETRVLDDDFTRIKLEAKSVKMKKMDDARHALYIEMNYGRNIIITGSCSSGNTTRASKCACNILNYLGYQVDMNYISNHEEFELEDKRDAHNVNFDIDIDETAIKNDILPNLKSKRQYDETEDLQWDFFKLIDYVSHYKPFETPGTHFSFYSSSFIQVNSYNYYLVGAENNECIDSIYLFRSTEVPFNNLTITFLGKIKSGTDLYKKLR
jgi:hypothetical protein